MIFSCLNISNFNICNHDRPRWLSIQQNVNTATSLGWECLKILPWICFNPKANSLIRVFDIISLLHWQWHIHRKSPTHCMYFIFIYLFFWTIKSSHYPRKIENLHAYQWHPTFSSPVLLLGQVTSYYHCYYYVKIVILYFSAWYKNKHLSKKEREQKQNNKRLVSYEKLAAKTQETVLYVHQSLEWTISV